MSSQQDWRQISAAKRGQRDSRIPDLWKLPPSITSSGLTNVIDVPVKCGILTADEIRITSDYDAVDIVELISRGTYSAEAVTTAFCKRAAIAQQLVNCLTEIFFDEAIAAAKSLDENRLANPDRPLNPLHGLPISIKDCFSVIGHDSTTGLVTWANKPATRDSALPELLKSLGAILYCKTNVPQTMLTADSDNNIFGRTLNPHNTKFTAGGSSGGEGALIALRGSILGVGTDVAGSIRIPSLCNGVYGVKPSADIIPYGGQVSVVIDGFAGITPSAGPLATSMRACRFFIETIMSANAWEFDSTALRIPWVGKAVDEKKYLRIGVVETDDVSTPSPPMRRALQQSVEKLSRAGITVIPVNLPDTFKIMMDIWGVFQLEGSQFVTDLIKEAGEPYVPSVALTGLVGRKPGDLERFFELMHNHHLAAEKYHTLFKHERLDAILTVPAPHTAVPHDQWAGVSYTALFNWLDYPAIVLPVGAVEARDVKDESAKFGENDNAVYSKYTGPEDYKSLPIGIQLVGQRQNDEELVHIAENIDRILKS